jgi:murein L,D-transpeptidase YcbB/YkuD
MAFFYSFVLLFFFTPAHFFCSETPLMSRLYEEKQRIEKCPDILWKDLVLKIQQHSTFCEKECPDALWDLLKMRGYVGEEDAIDCFQRILKRFQRCHCLKETGEINEETLKALSLSKEMILNYLETSIILLKNISPTESRFLLANIAGYKLYGFEKQRSRFEQTYEADTVVGSKERQTPLLPPCVVPRFVVNPIWYLPPTVVKKDVFPMLQKDPEAFKNKGYVVILRARNKRLNSLRAIDWHRYTPDTFHKRFRVEQIPGSHNGLGKVKIMVSNDQYIIIHGTPEKEHFDRASRAYSSGCLRLKYPEKLAVWLLNDDIKRKKFYDVLRTTYVTKGFDIPSLKIYFAYLPVWIDEKGRLCVTDDPYQRFGR